MTDLWGVYEGLNLAIEKGHTKVEIQIDNQEVCNALIRGTSKLGYGWGLL